MRESIKREGKPKALEWNEDHPARKLLYEELAAGRIPLDSKDMGPAEVFYTYSGTLEFQIEGMEYGPTFTGRLLGLRKIVKRDKKRADDDKRELRIAIENHKPPSHNHRGEPQWNGSEAQALLKQDIADGKHLTMKPSELRWLEGREAYRFFENDTFRWKIRQEVRTSKYLYTLKYKADQKLRNNLQKEGILGKE